MNTSQTPDVLFYVLASSDLGARDKFTAKLLQKILDQSRKADVIFNQEAEAQRFDLTLWGIHPQSFIPHGIEQDIKAPIQLYYRPIRHPKQDILINLHTQFQPQFKDYQRTIEILDQTDTLIQKGRDRYKQYKAQGIEPTVHKIGY